ncbi:hypothetical protein [Asticcacaulis sp.]|jgi:hypothetical protein|uniref:hypothetical protein n=1 Tax=unclassified Asticcacaulis TaxID=2628350 RepID=UPI0025C46983|nr:hypothetical protein [Asticcacaulis sp.]MCA1936642.1 hypothetical protein [Asticcacaulis sp.]
MRKSLSAVALGLGMVMLTQPVLAQNKPTSPATEQNALPEDIEAKMKALVTRMQATASKLKEIAEKMKPAMEANDGVTVCNLTKEMYPHMVDLRDGLKEMATYAPAGADKDKMNAQIEQMDVNLKSMAEAIKTPCT